MRISDWSSDVCSSDLLASLPSVIVGDRAGIRTSIGMDGFRSLAVPGSRGREDVGVELRRIGFGAVLGKLGGIGDAVADLPVELLQPVFVGMAPVDQDLAQMLDRVRSEEHTSELQSLMRISYSVFC